MRIKPIRTQSSPSRRRYWQVQLVYLVVSCFFLLIFLGLPANRGWLSHTVQRFYKQRRTLGERSDVAFRRQTGYGNAYRYTTLIKQHCQPTDYFLIPPQRYLIRNAYKSGRKDGFAWIYPSVLYYHLGQSVHLVELTAPDSLLQRVSYTFQAKHDTLSLTILTDQNRAIVLAEFARYNPRFFAYTPEQARAYYRSKL